MAEQWYYAKGSQQAGPVGFEQLVELARTGQVGPTDLVWRDGMPNWEPAGQVPGLLAEPAGAYGTPQQHHQQQPAYAQPVQYAGSYQPGYQAYPPGSVPNYLVQSILVTILCCWPFGIPAIVYAAQVNGKLAVGDYQGAVNSSNNAKMWSWIAFGLGLAVGVLYLLLIVGGAMAS